MDEGSCFGMVDVEGDDDDDNDRMVGSDLDTSYASDGGNFSESFSDEFDSEFEDDDNAAANKSNVSVTIGVTKKTRSKRSYVVRTPDEMVEWMETVADELSDEYNLSMYQARRILSFYQYDVESIREPLKYELEDTLQKAGLKLGLMDECDDDDKDGEEKKITCPICWEDVRASDMDALGCEHLFCKSCWKGHITESVKARDLVSLDRRSVVRLTCPHQRCDNPVPIDMLEKYGEKSFVAKRNVWYAEDIASKVPKFKLCTGPNCSNVIEFAFTTEQILNMPHETGELECTCKHWFCWTCQREAHAPCTCEEVNDWRSLSSEDAAVERLKSKCKLCPSCGTGCYINDKTACNHMICPCGHEWCWMCEGPWSEHGNSYYKCTKYTSSMKQKNMERDKKIADIQRLSDYEERVSRMAAGSTGKSAKLLRGKIKKMITDLETRCGHTQRELQFLWDAFYTVINMKRMLKWSWVFLFFRPESDGDAERVLFDSQRGQLEFMCDALHEKLCPVKDEDVKKFDSFLNRSSDTRHAFFEWKASIIGLLTQIAKFGDSITAAALKGTTIIDAAERSKFQRKLAKERLKLVEWEFFDGKVWHVYDDEIASRLELSKLMRQKTCSVSSKGVARCFDLTRNVELVGTECPHNRHIRRKVKAKLARNVWTCSKCEYQTPNDLNACTSCGTVRGH